CERRRLQGSVRHQVSVAGKSVKFLQQPLVLEQLVLIQIRYQHFSRTETAAMNNLLGTEVHQASFGPGDHQRVVGQEKSTGTKTIAIEGYANQVSIGKGQ